MANLGVPKWNGPVKPTQPASPTDPNLATLPPEPSLTSAASAVPITRPASTATVWMNPRVKRVRARMTRIVNVDRKRLVRLPNVRFLGTRSGLYSANWPPPASNAATGISVTPMIVITVPVTTGGKNRTSWEKYGARNSVTRPATMTAP